MRFVVWLMLLAGGVPVVAGDTAALEHFESKVRPLLLAHCVACHGPEKQEHGLRLDSRDGWRTGGTSGPAIVPGEVEQSLLIRAVRRADEKLQMPPKGPLAPEEVQALETWVRTGAVDPREGATAADRRVADPKTFWSFQPVRENPPPVVRQPEWVRTPVDAFVLAKLEAMGLAPAPRADARTLVRRAYFDLVGLPPTPEQVDAFMKDPLPDAWDRLIDHLLDSPQYGERWGRRWLDVARYADSGGFETDVYYRNAWRYRDYVVKSFNDDKPYNIFVQEQVAGDELWPDNLELNGSYEVPIEKRRHLEALIGTGLYTLGPQIHESNMDGKKIRYETLSDWVDTTGAAFMGLTFGCARCHDHKFDPITQRDYYAMQAVFAGSREVEVPLIDGMGVADFKQNYPRVIAVDEARRAVNLFDAATKGKDLSDADKQARERLLLELAGRVLAVQPKTAQGEPFDGLFEVPVATVLGHERPELVATVYRLNRGEVSRPQEAVAPDFPEALRAASGWTEAVPDVFQSRKALARWLTDPRHPLTARVMVNRLWNGHFGRGIVGSLNDFGQMGERPTHPELLDWLAAEFVREGWSIKRMHRVMMRSATYQMDSRWQNAQAAEVDPLNHFLWRMNRTRLDAEVLWDTIHAVAGTLNLKMGGRPVAPPLGEDEGAPVNWTVSADPAEHTRRGLYILQRRNFRFPMFDVFDLPVNAVSAPSRDVTTVATQALWLLNNPTVQRQAAAFAARLAGDANAGWNKPDFGPGQPGWEGARAGAHAGWARRVDNGNTTEGFDDPVGTVMTHGNSSVAWRVPTAEAGTIVVEGGLWNLRHLGRNGSWKLWKNEVLLTSGAIDDGSGTSDAPMSLAKGSNGAAALRAEAQPGDLFRLEILEGDFVGVRLIFVTAKTRHDIADEFSLASNPTTTGWQYGEALSNGGGPLFRAITAETVDEIDGLVDRAWRLGVGRHPTASEQQEALQLLERVSPAEPRGGLPQLCLAIFNLMEFSYVD